MANLEVFRENCEIASASFADILSKRKLEEKFDFRARENFPPKKEIVFTQIIPNLA